MVTNEELRQSLKWAAIREDALRTAGNEWKARAEAAEAKVARVVSVCSTTDGEWLDGDAEIPVGEVLRMLYPSGDLPSSPSAALDGDA